MKDYSDKNIFELMKIPTDELKELSIEEFAKNIIGKKVNIFPLFNIGDLSISVVGANIAIKNEKIIFEDNVHFHIELSVDSIFGIYSFEDKEHYRISLDGNNPDLLVTVAWWHN